jgi:hypothetical protein
MKVSHPEGIVAIQMRCDAEKPSGFRMSVMLHKKREIASLWHKYSKVKVESLVCDIVDLLFSNTKLLHSCFEERDALATRKKRPASE